MAAALYVLFSLEILCLEFSPSRLPPYGKTRSLPPQNRSVLPALRSLNFTGVTEYLEDLAVTFIDAPQLDFLEITFFNQIDSDCPRLAQFIGCSPTLRELDVARVLLYDFTVTVILKYRTSEPLPSRLMINFSRRGPNSQLSSLSQVCNPPLPPLSIVEDLFIMHQYFHHVWDNDVIENALWLQLLRPFISVKNLYLSEVVAPGIAPALQELAVANRMTEVLPNLQNIFVDRLADLGSFQENIGQFATARQRSGHPVSISVRNIYRTRT
jgi:hypothetical protein